MEINKQLFEDVLAGKLKGKFVLRNESIISSDWLIRAQQTKVIAAQSYPYILEGKGKYYCYYTENGLYIDGYTRHNLDIIDFIPDTDMKENELTIEIPKGKIVDWDESKKQNRIVLKDKQLSYKDICEKLLSEKSYLITNESTIHPTFEKNQIISSNCAFTQHQLECILAKNKLANVAKYLNDGWKPDISSDTYVINNYYGNLVVYLYKEDCSIHIGQVIFKTKELAQQAIEILGEETVKLALEPLGV